MASEDDLIAALGSPNQVAQLCLGGRNGYVH